MGEYKLLQKRNCWHNNQVRICVGVDLTYYINHLQYLNFTIKYFIFQVWRPHQLPLSHFHIIRLWRSMLWNLQIPGHRLYMLYYNFLNFSIFSALNLLFSEGHCLPLNRNGKKMVEPFCNALKTFECGRRGSFIGGWRILLRVSKLL